MNISMHNSYILLNTDALRRNIRTVLEELSGETALIPVLKDDAYGLGLKRVAEVLMEFSEIGMMAISHVSEGVQLREMGWSREILVLGGTMGFLLPTAVEQNLTLTVGRLDMVPELARLARERGKKAKVQLKVETGLHRIGVLPGEEMDVLIGELKENGDAVEVIGVFTHFADLDNEELAREQCNLFQQAVEQLEEEGIAIPMRHICGSAGSELQPQYRMDAVRIGRRLYMDHPTRPVGNIEEVASWRTFITNIRHLKAGDQLGYGGHCVLEKDAVVATIGVGYGDGLNTALADCRAPVLVGGQQASLLTCCMDQSMIDVTGIPCKVDDEVTLFGYDGEGNYLSSQEVSLLIGDNEGCGLISDLSPRVERIYE